jgi:branched-chain amino acid transport system permease protein
MDVVLQLLLNALVAGAIYALIASGLSFIYATTRVFHLAHGFVVACAGYVFWWAWQEHRLPVVVSALVACCVACAVGLLMNEFIYEPLRMRKTKGLGYLVATIALLMFGNALLIALFGAQPHSLNIQTSVYDLSGARISLLQIGILCTTAVLLVGTLLLIRNTKFGKAMRATADSETVAEILGINTRNVRRLTFLLGSLLGGIAGVLVSLEFNIDPNMGVMLAIKGFTAMVIGGAGSMGGVIVGSVLLGGAEQAAVWFFGSGWKNAMAFALLFLFLLAKPTGLFWRSRFS